MIIPPPNQPGQYPSYPSQPQQPYGYGYGPGQGPYAMQDPYAAPQRPPLAEWGARVCANLVDGLIGAAVPIVGFIVAGVMMAMATDCSPSGLCQRDEGLDAAASVVWILSVVAAVAAQVWIMYAQGRTGQSPGKKALHIAVLRERDGMPIGFWMTFVRNLCHFFDGITLYLGYLWPLWDRKHQTFADKMVGTVVVRTR
ncbi:RDD family protein [Streptomyces sp. NPDC053048]|uniref:RDD family protein n=1 Tax=Streptomyces sp. NPDC053048 TaxID=3365694 RepID=UPI0037D26927